MAPPQQSQQKQTKSGKPRSPPRRRNDIVNIMPCFFDLQVQTVIKLLRMSSHTMMRIRKELSLDRWPFERISHGHPVVWKGETMDWDDVQRFRTKAMETVSPEMKAILHKCDRNSILMRAMFQPGFLSTVHESKKRNKQAEAFIEGVETIIMQGRVMPEEEPVASCKQETHTEPVSCEHNRDEDRQLLEDIGLLDFELPEVPVEAWSIPTVEDGYWPELEASPEQEAYWSDVGRLLFECAPL